MGNLFTTQFLKVLLSFKLTFFLGIIQYTYTKLNCRLILTLFLELPKIHSTCKVNGSKQSMKTHINVLLFVH